MWVRELKLSRNPDLAGEDLSHPMWVRELKRSNSRDMRDEEVAPHGGA